MSSAASDVYKRQGLHRSRFDVRVGKDRLTNESGVRLPSGIWPVFSPFLCICGPSGCRRREVQRLGRCPAGMGAPPETLAASSFLLPIFGAGSPPSRSQDSVLLVSQVGQMGKVVASVTDEGWPGLFWLETQLSLIHISEPTRRVDGSRMPSSA